MALCLPGALILPGRGGRSALGPTCHAGHTPRGASVLHPLTSRASRLQQWNVPSLGGGGNRLLPPGPGDSCSTGPRRRGLPARARHGRTVRPTTAWMLYDSGFLLTRPSKGIVGWGTRGDVYAPGLGGRFRRTDPSKVRPDPRAHTRPHWFTHT